MSNNLHHVENLLRMVADKDATIARQAAQLEQYAKMLDDERATVLVLRESIVQLRTALDAVPLQAIFRFIYGTQYDTPNDSDADRAVINAWLRKELSADE